MPRLFRIAVLLVSIAMLLGCMPIASPGGQGSQIEPEAGNWETWVLTSAADVLPAAPPDAAATQAEIAELKTIAASATDEEKAQVTFWNAGAPNYRWTNVGIAAHAQAGIGPTPRFGRNMSLVNVAIYDAMVAAWNAKYTYHRARPSTIDPTFKPLMDVPNSPSYPSERAVAAGAASSVLAYLFPDRADEFAAMAEQAAHSLVVAGVHYPSDVEAGLELGRAVAAQVIARAQADGSDAPWEGSVPTEPGHWTGENPVQPNAGSWQTWVLTSGDQLRPAAPPAYDSEQMQVELDALKAITPTVPNTLNAFFYQSPRGTSQYFFSNLSRLVFEEGLDSNPVAAARVYAAASVAMADAFISCYDAKYTYWSPRPSMVDAEFKSLFPNPNFPSYPSAHSCVSTAVATVLADFFPGDAAALLAGANEAGDSRMWAGIHFQSDIDAGEAIGQGVAELVLAQVTAMTNRSAAISSQ